MAAPSSKGGFLQSLVPKETRAAALAREKEERRARIVAASAERAEGSASPTSRPDRLLSTIPSTASLFHCPSSSDPSADDIAAMKRAYLKEVKQECSKPVNINAQQDVMQDVERWQLKFVQQSRGHFLMPYPYHLNQTWRWDPSRTASTSSSSTPLQWPRNGEEAPTDHRFINLHLRRVVEMDDLWFSCTAVEYYICLHKLVGDIKYDPEWGFGIWDKKEGDGEEDQVEWGP